MSITLVPRIALSQDQEIYPPQIAECSARRGLTVSLAQRSLEHDESLPQYPVPSYHYVVKAIKEYAVVLDSLGKFSNHVQYGTLEHHEGDDFGSLASSLETLDKEIEETYLRTAQKFVQRHSTPTSTAWATNAFKSTLLMQRVPLSYETLALLLYSPTTNQVAAAARLLYALASIYVSPNTLEIYDPNKRFETRQLVELFATTRIPGEKMDVLRTHPGTTHAVIWYAGRAYKVHIIDSRGDPIPPSELADHIQKILNVTPKDPTRSTVATWSNLRTRPEWATRRGKILKAHSTALNDLESAITSIALHSFQPESPSAQMKSAKTDPYDVYADKTLSFSVFAAGAIAARGDHVAADGGPLGHLISLIDQGLKRTPKIIRLAAKDVKLMELEFGISEEDLMTFNQPSPLHSAVKFHDFKLLRNAKILDALRSSRLLNFVLQIAYQNALLCLAKCSEIRIVEPTSVRNFAEGRCTANYVMTNESLELCQNLRTLAPSQNLHRSFLLALNKYRDQQKKARENASVSWGMMLLVNSIRTTPESEKRSLLLKTLSVLTKKTAYFTGSAHGESIRAAEAFVFQLDQISLVYYGHAENVAVCLAGSGVFQDCLKAVQALMEEGLDTISNLAVAALDGHS